MISCYVSSSSLPHSGCSSTGGCSVLKQPCVLLLFGGRTNHSQARASSDQNHNSQQQDGIPSEGHFADQGPHRVYPPSKDGMGSENLNAKAYTSSTDGMGSGNLDSLSSRSTRVAMAWQHWRNVGAPKLIVAPMADQSELPFRMLCRKYGATAAYTPMLHARLFVDDPNYRLDFTTCPEDRPLFVQFCGNDPDTLLAAAKMVEPMCDYVDINLGCPQRVAKRGRYGAFLMNDLPLVQSIVEKLASHLLVPVSCKIRIFPDLEDTLAYVRMLEEAGCSLLAVHGRTRYQKDSKRIRADWNAIKAVKEAVGIPVLANGNIRCLDDVNDCLKETGVDGVMSAESLLENPALFAGYKVSEPTVYDGSKDHIDKERSLDQLHLLREYLDLVEKYPVRPRMVRSHVYGMLGPWFRVHNDLREQLNNQFDLSRDFLEGLVHDLANRKERIDLVPPKT